MLIEDSDSPSAIEALDESSSSPIASLRAHVVSLYLDDVQASIPALEVSTPLGETLTVPSLVNLDHGVSRMQLAPEPFLNICSSDNQKLGTPNVSTPKMIIDEPYCVGPGLTNLGNTCFINVVLQCLTHTYPLLKSLFSHDPQNPCHCGNEKFCLLRALTDHIHAAMETELLCLAPVIFIENLTYFSPHFKHYEEGDAQEFLLALMDKLEICCGDVLNFVGTIFGGHLGSRLCCRKCGSYTETSEPFLDLSLELQDADDLHSALDSFLLVEYVDSTCTDCNQHVSKEKQLFLVELGDVVTFHLKRFKSNGFTMEKISSHVSFPLEIDLQPYMPPPEPENIVNTKYLLYASVEHLGSLASGHYCSYVKSAPKIWHKFSDEQVLRIDEDTVLSQDAYMLFYAREGTPWLSSLCEVVDTLPNPSPNSLIDPTFGVCSSENSYENLGKRCDDSAGIERAPTCDDDTDQHQDLSQK